MRVTNSMISNSARQHIATAKNKVLTAEEQYTTEKKILRPSDDPVIASRALKFRNTYSQLTQFLEKNVQDAMDWMDSTEGAMDTVSSIFEDMKSRLNQGANGDLKASERTAVLEELRQYANSIFEDCANADYAGRYLFTGYRTDTSLLFPTESKTLEYKITENFELSDIALIRNVTSNIGYDETDNTADNYAGQEAKVNDCYRLQLAYANCSDTAINGDDTNTVLTFTAKKEDGTTLFTYKAGTDDVAIVPKDDVNAYNIEAYNEKKGASAKILYIPETGELVIDKDTYADMQKDNLTFSVDYTKKEFDKNAIRPEMYFECSCYNTVSQKTIQYADPSGQELNYEVSTRQEMTVNIQAKDAFGTDIYRHLDYIARTIDAVNEVENKIAEVEKKIAETPSDDDTGALEALETLKEALENEQKLRESVMNDAFGAGLTMIDNTSHVVDVTTAKLGARYKRLQLTYEKLMDQQMTAEEQMSDNEDISISDAIINLTQADNLYQASLSATAKILGNSLLNYI